jgi:hypothetical protein
MARAFASFREATATTSHKELFIIPGTTFVLPILAVLKIPQRTGCMSLSQELNG